MAKPDIQVVTADLTKDVVYTNPGKASLSVKIFKSGSGTLSGGAATVTDADVLAASRILISDTTGANAIAVTSKSAGSFVVAGTSSDTFEYLVINL